MTQVDIDVLSKADVMRVVAAGESQRVEFKRGWMPANRLAWVVTGFANADGGMILVGVEESGSIIGVDRSRIREMVDGAISQIEPRPDVLLNFVQCSGKDVAVIRIKKSDRIVIADDGAFIRVGAMTKAMTRSEISHKLSASPVEPSIPQLADAVARQTHTIEKLREELSASSSLASKMMDYFIGGIIGAIIGVVLGALLG